VPLPTAVTLLGTSVFLLAGADEAYCHQIPADWRALIYGLGAALMVRSASSNWERPLLVLLGQKSVISNASPVNAA
jgi:hypothetical protein